MTSLSTCDKTDRIVKILVLLSADGTLGKRGVFADVTVVAKDDPGVHQEGLFAAGAGGIHVYLGDGKRLCRIRTKTKGNGW